MTEHGHNFIREIAEAYRALEAEQGHLDTIARHEKQRVTDGETIARLEMRIMDLKAQQDETQAKLRSVEAERDEAGFRALEAEDRLDGIKRAIGMPEAIAKAKAEGIAEATPKAEPKLATQTANMEQALTGQGWHEIADQTQPVPEIVKSIEDAGQSVADPIAPVSTPSMESAPTQHSEYSASPSVGSSQTSEPKADGSLKPYHNKRYHDHPYYVSLQGWLNGGGTEEDYNWRPDTVPPAQAAQ
jgi:hypothetical protein